MLYEFLTPILEDNTAYKIRYYKNGSNWDIKVLDRNNDEIDTFTVKSVMDRDTELEYLKNDYQTLDCKEGDV